MKNIFDQPNWVPRLSDNYKIIVTGGTGGLGSALIRLLLEGSKSIIGVHGDSKKTEFQDSRIIPLKRHFNSEKDCSDVIKEFVDRAKGIDALVVLNGSIKFSGHWMNISEDQWNTEIRENLSFPFFLARAAMKAMISNKTSGKIVMTGTESSLHGGSKISMPYAIAKRGTECMVQGLAKEGAPHNILVNGLRLGYFESGFHQRWHNKTKAEMQERAELVPLKRGGNPIEAAAMVLYLLSGYGDFITGQMVPLTGGDWL
ncbi:MAG: 3-oxoacyl-[acyl-carrier-protein] reductase FabG [Alphaproteobacteria bacterium MarineAlpha3_Bin7]|nr:MAG: 3-oxoacyl-[acyl-carrier-protein] reductase FabG [Alphaproteobacteria bacterium MarineAlpha3_Bin7]|tara:strand:+ start:2115 stop:2888 length:774 start_codon:yes stop_codon:yes gene_type:complete